MKYYVIIFIEGDIDTINGFVKEWEKVSDSDLISEYNKQQKLGLTGVKMQALFLCALGHLFYRRFGNSPVKLEENVLSLEGRASIKEGRLVVT